MSASIARWQLVHLFARASALLVSYRPVAFSSASCVLSAARCCSVQPLVLCLGPQFFGLAESYGPWQLTQLTPSSFEYCLPRSAAGTSSAWHCVQRALAVASGILSFSAI